MIKTNKILVFSMILFIALGVACAADIDDAAAQSVDTPSQVSEVVGETVQTEASLPVEEEVGDTDSRVNPTEYDSIEETTYSNAVITLTDDQTFTDGVATFGNNVILTSTDSAKTLNNLKIVVSGSNVTINNVIFNHQTSTASKVIDVNGANNVLINNTDITLSKSNAVTTMAISVSNSNDIVINSSNIDVSSASQGLVWNEDSLGNWYSTIATSAVIVDDSSNVKIANGTIKIQNTTNNLSGTTMPALTIRNGANHVAVYNNTINATGAQYNYGIMCNDYINNLDIKYNRVNVTGEIYTAGMDVSTSTSSQVKYNNITTNSTNSSVLTNGSEALSYGIILATYQVQNNNNIVSYNNINLLANVGYGIENYMGSINTIEYNNITIHAKRTIGIATNASNSNNYQYNNINLYCNNDQVNNYYETIPAQNVGIIVIGAKNNNIKYNNITLHDDSTNTETYAIILSSDSSKNTAINNTLYVYNNNIITKQGDAAVSNLGIGNQISPNLPSSSNLLINKDKSIKMDYDNIIIIDGSNIATYGTNTTSINVRYNVPSNSYVIVNADSIESPIRTVNVGYTDPTIYTQINATNIYRVVGNGPIVNTYMPWAGFSSSVNDLPVINSTFLYHYDTKRTSTLINSTILNTNENIFKMDFNEYGSFFDSNSNILLSKINDDSILILRNNTTEYRYSNYNNPMIINKPINIISYDDALYNADITFIAGSEGSNITGLTLNGNLYINTSNINVKNNTINKGVIIKDVSETVIEENTFNTEETPITLTGAIESTIQNNNITTTSTYTITLDEDSMENTITSNNLQAQELTGIESILDNGEDNKITAGGDEPVTVETTLKVDTTEFTVGESTTITASIYKGDEIATDITGGKVVFKVNGVTLKDAKGKVIYAKLVNGQASITDYTIPDSWNKEGLTITAVYSGSSSQEALRSEAQEITVTKTTTPAIALSDVTSAKGNTITLTATVTDGNNPITTGKVVFKVNGKTVKDANGKVIYANVQADGTATVDYAIPTSMKAKDYTITAVFTSAKYDKLTADATLTVSN